MATDWQHFGGSELAVTADGKIADAQASDFDADQLEHFASDGFQHAAHLPVAAFVQSDFDERIFLGIADALHSRGLSGAVAERHAIAQLLKLFVAEQCGRLHQIRFGNFVIWIGDPLGKARVAGEQQQSAGVLIQPADGNHPASGVLDEIVNRGAAFGILEGGDVAGGLVEQQVDFLGRFDQVGRRA